MYIHAAHVNTSHHCIRTALLCATPLNDHILAAEKFYKIFSGGNQTPTHLLSCCGLKYTVMVAEFSKGQTIWQHLIHFTFLSQ